MGQTRLLALTGLLVLGVAALLRNTPRLAPGMFDWAEPGNVAAALAQGRGFSDPFDGQTGATAWTSPLPVWIEAGTFLAVGVKTTAAARLLLVLTVLGLGAANALLACALAPFGRWLAALAAGTFVAFCALLPGGPLAVLSEAWLDILLSVVLLWSVLGLGRPGAWAPRAGLILVGLLAPLESAGLGVAAGLAVLAAAWRVRHDRRALAIPVLAAAAAALAGAGWALRNHAALGRYIPLKSNSWFELHLANVDSADGLPRMETVLRRLPFFDVQEFRRYSELGEVKYVDSFRAPALAALRADPLHFAGNILRRAEIAVVFCRREGGGESTRYHFLPDDAARLAAAGELIPFGVGSGLWTRIDTPPGEERWKLHQLRLREEDAVVADWAARRVAFDAEFRGPAAIALGFLTAGIPVAALLGAALLGGGRLAPPAAWAALIAFGMLLPYVLVNNNDRHQLPLVALQAVALGALAEAWARRRAGAVPA